MLRIDLYTCQRWDVLVMFLQRNRTSRMCTYLLFIYFKEVANMTREPGKSKAFRVDRTPDA